MNKRRMDIIHTGKISDNKGAYILGFRLAKGEPIRIGKLGNFHFKEGFYLYVGSALGPGGLAARVRRHLRMTKPFRWHNDYFRAKAQLTTIWFAEGMKRFECAWASALDRWAFTSCPVKGFGASDCSCTSHFFYVHVAITPAELNHLLIGYLWACSHIPINTIFI